MTDLDRGPDVAARPDHPPPWDPFATAAEDRPNRPGRSRVTGLVGDLAIRDHLAPLEGVDDAEHGVFEIGHNVPKSLSPMSPRPGAM